MELTFCPWSNGRIHEDKLSRGREKRKCPESLLSLLKKYLKMDLVDVINITGKKKKKKLPGSVNNFESRSKRLEMSQSYFEMP